jgi:maltooligosyltrehalose synthase
MPMSPRQHLMLRLRERRVIVETDLGKEADLPRHAAVVMSQSQGTAGFNTMRGLRNVIVDLRARSKLAEFACGEEASG